MKNGGPRTEICTLRRAKLVRRKPLVYPFAAMQNIEFPTATWLHRLTSKLARLLLRLPSGVFRHRATMRLITRCLRILTAFLAVLSFPLPLFKFHFFSRERENFDLVPFLFFSFS